jgi:DNA polymerase-4
MSERTPSRPVYFHIDLDAFYAAVEQLDEPELRGRPVIVGASPGSRGVVSSCSYEARRFGIRSAMPISRAARKCPQGIFRPVRMQRYLEASEQVMSILSSFTPEFRQLSIDEASLDLSGTERLYGPPLQLAARIKQRVKDETGLTLSIGLAPNRYLAKLASEYGKPDGLFQVIPGQEIAFLNRLELKDLWGVGKKSLTRLQELNITSIERLRGMPADILCSMMGEAGGRYLYTAVRGGDPGIYSQEPKSHSLSSEITFEEDKKDSVTIRRAILELSEQVMYRLLRGGYSTNTAVLKVRFFDFTTTAAQRTLRHSITSSDELYRLAHELLLKRWNGSTPIRLIGVGTANVRRRESSVQGELFEDEYARRRKVEEAVTDIRQRISGVKLTKASLLGRKARKKGDPPGGGKSRQGGDS